MVEEVRRESFKQTRGATRRESRSMVVAELPQRRRMVVAKLHQKVNFCSKTCF